MSFGSKITLVGPTVSPNLNLVRSQSDNADDAAVLFGTRLLVRADPRDVRKTTDNPSGKKRIHYMAPNRDPLLYTGSGITVGPISGKYNGLDVFTLTNVGNAAAGTHNDLTVGPKSLNNISEFSVFGAAHFDSGMLGAGTHFLFTMFRDRANIESVVFHQFTGGVNYLTIQADQGGGGGSNHVLDGSAVFAAGVPFAYMFRVKSATPDRASLFINQVATANLTTGATAVDLPETGSMEMYLGHVTADSNQWPGGHGRAYVVSGDALDTPDNAAISASLMLELKALYSIP